MLLSRLFDGSTNSLTLPLILQAIGSSTYGNVTDVLMEGGRIGDDNGSSPWAVKVKTHTPRGGVVSNITLKGVRLGRIAPNKWQQPNGGTALFVLLEPYNNPPFPPGAPQPSASRFSGISLIDVYALEAVTAGVFEAAAPLAIEGLSLQNVTFGSVTSHDPWSCARLNGTVAKGVEPPLPQSCF